MNLKKKLKIINDKWIQEYENLEAEVLFSSYENLVFKNGIYLHRFFSEQIQISLDKLDDSNLEKVILLLPELKIRLNEKKLNTNTRQFFLNAILNDLMK